MSTLDELMLTIALTLLILSLAFLVGLAIWGVFASFGFWAIPIIIAVLYFGKIVNMKVKDEFK